MNLPATLDPSVLTLAKAESIAAQLVAFARDAEMEEAIEALDRASAIEEYLAKRDLAGPMQLAERHLERRIGELLGPATAGRPKEEERTAHGTLLARNRQNEFRLISEYWAAVEKVLPCSRAEAIRAAQKIRKQKEETPPADCTLEQWQQLSLDDRSRALAYAGTSTFNRGADEGESAIEWAKWSWNPVTGCLHNCPYCYARDIAKDIYAQGFEPVLRPSRLTAPANTSVPAEAKREIGLRNVFTCSMADLFGKWVPQEWIEAVLDQVRNNPQWNFLFLTKFPVRLSQFDFPDNAWVGTTVDCQVRVKNAERSFRQVRAKVKWLSVEPMLEPLHFEDLGAFQWVVIGGASSSSQTPEWHPHRDWSDDLRRAAQNVGCQVYEKTNLLRPYRQYPGLNSEEPELPKSLRYLPTLEATG